MHFHFQTSTFHHAMQRFKKLVLWPFPLLILLLFFLFLQVILCFHGALADNSSANVGVQAVDELSRRNEFIQNKKALGRSAVGVDRQDRTLVTPDRTLVTPNRSSSSSSQVVERNRYESRSSSYSAASDSSSDNNSVVYRQVLRYIRLKMMVRSRLLNSTQALLDVAQLTGRAPIQQTVKSSPMREAMMDL